MIKNSLILICIMTIGMSSFRSEIETKLDTSNPFAAKYTTPFEVPPFDKIKNAHYLPAFEQGMLEQKREVELIVNSPKKQYSRVFHKGKTVI